MFDIFLDIYEERNFSWRIKSLKKVFGKLLLTFFLGEQLKNKNKTKNERLEGERSSS
jgi:hypothetical protein